MKGIVDKINFNDFKSYLFFSIILLLTLISIRTLEFTQARYESNTQLSVSPSIAFFIVDVMNTSGQIKLDSMIPRDEPYLYSFEVSNFKDGKRANVDLTYSIEIITTTNMPLEFKIFKGGANEINRIDSDMVTTDENGVYYRHLLINGVSQMPYSTNTTDTYTLWVSFPSIYKANPEIYEGIIDLVDIKINAEQVV